MNKKTFRLWFYRLSSLLLAISYLLVIVTLGRLGIVPNIYLFITAMLTAPFVGWLAMLIFRQTTPAKKRNIATGFAILFSILGMWAFTTLHATVSFLANLDQSPATYDSYSVIAKKERHVVVANAKNVTYIKGDTNDAAVRGELKKITSAEQTPVDALTPMIDALGTGSADMGTVRDSQLELLKEADQAFYQTIEVLATFKVRAGSSRATTAINTSKPFALYISGIDTYGEVASVARSDVNMLVVVNPRTHKVLLVNTPRDYYVQLHGTSGQRDKLTHAGVYGIDMSIKTMEDLYGVTIDSYARVNFSSLVSIVDTLGGVTVYSDHAFKSFAQGYNTLNGAQALEFSRERYSFSEGDRTRGRNQQRVIEAIIQKIQNPSVLMHYSSLLSAVKSSLQTNMSGETISSLVNQQLSNRQAWSAESISVDGVGKMASTYSMGVTPLYVMEPDAASLLTAKQKIVHYLERP